MQTACLAIVSTLAALAAIAPAYAQVPVDYAKVRGVNWFPSYGYSSAEAWDRFDARTFDFELSYAHDLGFNSVRVWLNYYSYAANPELFLERVGTFLDLCAKYQLTSTLILFDSCGVEPEDYSGEVLRLEDAYQKTLKEVTLSGAGQKIFELMVGKDPTTLGRDIKVPYSTKDPSTLIWKWWTSNPGYSQLGKDDWPKYEAYVSAVLGKYGNHPQVLLWEVMNEPEISRVFTLDSDWSIIEAFVRRMCAVASEISPRKPLTIGAAGLNITTKLADAVDVLSFHSYERNANLLKGILEEAKKLADAQSKPILITECLVGFNVGPGETLEQGQLKFYQEQFPIILHSGIGFYSLGLIQGNFGGMGGYVHTDGHRKPVADYLTTTLAEEKAGGE